MFVFFVFCFVLFFDFDNNKGFAFSRGDRALDVASDPYLPYLFDGEEILMTVRLWTHGYDLYMPDRDVVFHIYEQYHPRPLFWKDDWNRDKIKFEKRAQRRVNYILGLWDKCCSAMAQTPDMVDLRNVTDLYGLGKEREVSNFWPWIQLDWSKLKNTKNCDKNDDCKSNNWCHDITAAKIKRLPTISELSQKK